MEQTEFSIALYRMLDGLPDVYRSVITLIDLYELEYAEAAQALNVPIGTIKSRLARARLQMKQKLIAVMDYSGNFGSNLTSASTTDAALSKVSTQILENHLNSCVIDAIKGNNPKERERVLKEITEVFDMSKKV